MYYCERLFKTFDRKYSIQGSPQWVSLEFEHPVTVSALCLQFQGKNYDSQPYIFTWISKQRPAVNLHAP